jgi:hypothetical protein
MWRAIWQLAAHRTLTWYLPVFLLLSGYTLVVTHPLGIDLPAVVFGALQGWVLAFRLFVDPPAVSPFIFSRPFSRSRLFFCRWTIGLLLQALTLAVIFVIIASGLRQMTQVYLFRSAWYPMVRWFELSALWPIGLASLLTYQATCFVLLRRRFRGNRRISKFRLTGNAAFMALAGMMAVIFVVGYVASRFMGVPYPYWERLPLATTSWSVLIFSYTVLLVATTTLASLYCYQHLEVDA